MYFFIIVLDILFIAFIAYWKRPSTRGKRGENKVSSAIGNTIENEQYVINNLILVNDGKSVQIDHIVINPRGIFVIETKNYSGEIYGSESQREWSQVLAYGKVKNKLYLLNAIAYTLESVLEHCLRLPFLFHNRLHFFLDSAHLFFKVNIQIVVDKRYILAWC